MSLYYDESQPSALQRKWDIAARQARQRINAKAIKKFPSFLLPPKLKKVPQSAPLKFRRDWLFVASRPCGMTKSQAHETIEMVAKEYGLHVADLTGRSRERAIALPRHIAMYLIKTIGRNSYPEIARFLKRSDHTTPLSAVKKLGKMQSDLAFRAKIQEFERRTRIIIGLE